MHLQQTPTKRSILPPITPLTNSNNGSKLSLPPLSSILPTAPSSHYRDHPLTTSTPYKAPLPSINTSAAYQSPSMTYGSYIPTPESATSLVTSSNKRSFSVLDDSSIMDTSILEERKLKASTSSSVAPTSSSSPTLSSPASTPTDNKAYAFISHSLATFPLQEPSIDNAPLARRKRRRTSPHELNILNQEFALGTTPNKSRRIQIAKKVSMTEKAVQIWFQNKRQSIRKQLNLEKEITVLPPTSNYPPFQQHQPEQISTLPPPPPAQVQPVQPVQSVQLPIQAQSTPLPKPVSISPLPITNSYTSMKFKFMPSKSKVTRKLQECKALGDITNLQ